MCCCYCHFWSFIVSYSCYHNFNMNICQEDLDCSGILNYLTPVIARTEGATYWNRTNLFDNCTLQFGAN